MLVPSIQGRMGQCRTSQPALLEGGAGSLSTNLACGENFALRERGWPAGRLERPSWSPSFFLFESRSLNNSFRVGEYSVVDHKHGQPRFLLPLVAQATEICVK